MQLAGTDVHRPKIAVVEDERGTAELIQMILKARGYDTELIFSGTRAVEMFEAMAGQVSPWRPFPVDLVLLDIMMPGADGFRVCQTIKLHPLLRYIPVIMVTALDSASDKIAAVEFGADGYITKPFLPEELHAAIKARLQVKRREELLLRRNAELAALDAVAAAAASTLDPERVIEQAFAALIECCELSAAAMYVVRDGQSQMRRAAWHGIERPAFLPLDEGLPRQILYATQPVLKVDLTEDPDLPRAMWQTGGLQSFVGVSLQAGEERLGLLEMYRAEPYGWDDTSLPFFNHLGQRIGMAMQNAQIFHHTQQLLLESSTLSIRQT